MQAVAAYRIRPGHSLESVVDEAFAGLLEGVYIYDFPSGSNVYINDRYRDLTGYSLADLEALAAAGDFITLFHQDDRDAVIAHMSAVAEGALGEIHTIEYRFRAADGRWLWCLSRDTLLKRAPDGTARQLVGHFLDVSAQRKALDDREAALRREREAVGLLDAIFSAAPIGIGFWDREFRFQRVNPRLAEFNGLSPEAHLGKRPDELLPDVQGLDDIMAGWRRLLETGEPVLDVEVRGRTRAPSEQERVWVEDFFPVRVGNEIIGLGAVIEEITERRQAEAALAESEARYRTLFQSIDEGFCIVQGVRDAAGQITDWHFLETNPAFERHTGVGDAQGKTAKGMFPDMDERLVETCKRIALNQAPERFVHRSRLLHRWFDVDAFPLGDPAELKVALLFNNITHRKRKEDRLRASDRRKDEFLATLAHELRNPLAPLRSGIDILRIDGDDPAGRDRVLGVMERQMEQLVRMVDDLLDVSRITRGKVELRRQVVDLRDVVSCVLESAIGDETGRREVCVELSEEPLPVLGDRARLIQVLGNLLGNAFKCTPLPGRIWITADREGNQARICVRDEGIGIEPERLDDIFEIFYQVDGGPKGGLGIGLTLVQSLVSLHGGTVEAYSDGRGRGSEFIVLLPLDARPALEPTVKPREARLFAGERFMVVDDNKDVADTLAILLKLLGATVRTANDGVSALALFEAFEPQAVLLDIGMPGMDGYAVARGIRASAAGRYTLLFAVTGFGQDADKARALAAGFDDHLTKPLDPDAFRHIADRLRPAQ
jgi:PAS domain S-box-containing protein